MVKLAYVGCQFSSKRRFTYFLTNSMEFTLNKTLNIISRREICKQIGVSRDTLKNWIKNRNFPEPLKASGREPLFDEQSVKNGF